MRAMIEWYLADGEAIHAAGRTVIPRSRVLSMRVPNAAFVWQRPESVLIQTADGSQQRINIVDVTRIAQIALLGWLVLALVAVRSRS
jgi:hypothetical protein